MTPKEMAYYKGCQDGRKDGKIAGLKMALNNFTENVIIDGWDYKTLNEYQEWLEQQIEDLENGK